MTSPDLVDYYFFFFFYIPPFFLPFGYCVFLYKTWLSPWVAGSAVFRWMRGVSLISMSHSVAFSGAFPFFLSAAVRNNLEAEGRGQRKRIRDLAYFSFSVLVFVFVIQFLEMGWGLKGKDWLVRYPRRRGVGPFFCLSPCLFCVRYLEWFRLGQSVHRSLTKISLSYIHQCTRARRTTNED